MNRELQELIASIISESERPDKMKVEINLNTKSMIVTYEDMDEQWVSEILILTNHE